MYLNIQTECKVEGELVAPEFVEPLPEASAKEGQPHRLTCRVVGHPTPVVSWFKNDVCVDHYPDYAITFDDDGQCTLSFDEVILGEMHSYSSAAKIRLYAI